MKDVLDNIEFWETMRYFLSDKYTLLSQISIEKNHRNLSDNFDLPEEFSC